VTNILFLYQNQVDTASLYPTSEDNSLPANNIKNAFRQKVWEVDSPVADLVIDFGSEKAVTAVAMVNYDWAAAPNSLYLEFSASSFSPASGQTQALTWCVNPTSNSNPACIIKTFALNSSYRYARLRVHADSAWQMGRLFLGEYFEPTHNMLHDGYGYNLNDPSILSQALCGPFLADIEANYRSLNMQFVVRTQAQLEAFQKMWNTVGVGKSFFLAADYDNEPNEMTMYGKLAGMMGTGYPEYGKRTLSLKFREER
jgi:hypothetical protein